MTPKFNPLDYPTLSLEPEVVSPLSAWIEHIPFAYALIAMVKPRRLVELGVHFGDSYCAFCQAVVHLGLVTRCFGIDTWQGDKHARLYAPDVLKGLRSHHDATFGSFSQLMPMEFDSALSEFEDGSVDLLHIDGLHTYEAVKHDYETWLPKLSNRGVVVFHDTQARHEDFGVYQLWAELSIAYPHFEFEHGEGLGILAVGPDVPPELLPLLQAKPTEANNIRNYYTRLGFTIAMQRFYGQVMQTVFQGQSVINQWKQKTGQLIVPGPPDLQSAMSDSLGFTQQLVREVQAMARADLDRRRNAR